VVNDEGPTRGGNTGRVLGFDGEGGNVDVTARASEDFVGDKTPLAAGFLVAVAAKTDEDDVDVELDAVELRETRVDAVVDFGFTGEDLIGALGSGADFKVEFKVAFEVVVPVFAGALATELAVGTANEKSFLCICVGAGALPAVWLGPAFGAILLATPIMIINTHKT
jgi:hypothetical protein